jgi:membrane-associated protein
MGGILQLFDFILHIDAYLFLLIQDYGIWIYAILFLIIFVETGLVFMPLLPGDSLLFAAGTFCAGVMQENEMAQLMQTSEVAKNFGAAGQSLGNVDVGGGLNAVQSLLG